MRVLYIDPKFGNPRASSHARVVRFAQRLKERGHDVTVVGRDSCSLALDRTDGARSRGYARGRLDGLDVVLLHVPYEQSFSKWKRILAYGGFTAAAAAAAAALGPADAVVASSSPLTIGISGVTTSRLRRAAFVFEIQDLWPAIPIALGVLRSRAEIRTAEWLERRLYAAAATVIVCSEGASESLRARGVPARKIVLIPNVADVEHFRPDIVDPTFRERHGLEGKFVALYAGALGATNGIDQLADAAEALARAKEGRVVIAVAGNGTERARLEQRARELPTLVMLPDVPREEIPRIVGAADATITAFAPVPALETNSPNKFFDSLAAGKPSVVNLDGWLRRLVEEHRAGVYVPAGDGQRLAGALAELAASPELAAELGQNGRALAEREFSADLLADRFADTVECAAMDRSNR